MEETGEKLGLELSFVEARVLGALMEKEVTTPAYYPMTLNSLQAACNQRSSREPVTEFDEATVERGVEGLREKRLAVKVHLAGSRTPKYKHTFENAIHVDPAQQALLCVLLLRGAQTPGELNQRTDRLHAFASLEEVENTLRSMANLPAGALVREIPAGMGRRVATYVHLLCGEPDLSAAVQATVSAEQIVLEEEASWRRKLEDEVAGLRGQLEELKAQFEALRRELT